MPSVHSISPERWSSIALAQLKRRIVDKENHAKDLLAAISAGCDGQKIRDAIYGLSWDEWRQLEAALACEFFYELVDRHGKSKSPKVWRPRTEFNLVSIGILLKAGVHPDIPMRFARPDDEYDEFDGSSPSVVSRPMEVLSAQPGKRGTVCIPFCRHANQSTIPVAPQRRTEGNDTHEAIELLLVYGAKRIVETTIPDKHFADLGHRFSAISIKDDFVCRRGVDLQLVDENVGAILGLSWLNLSLTQVRSLCEQESDATLQTVY